MFFKSVAMKYKKDQNSTVIVISCIIACWNQNDVALNSLPLQRVASDLDWAYFSIEHAVSRKNTSKVVISPQNVYISYRQPLFLKSSITRSSIAEKQKALQTINKPELVLKFVSWIVSISDICYSLVDPHMKLGV